jgi:hypothetical protein
MDHRRKFSNPAGRDGVRKLPDATNSAPREHKTFDALNFSAFRSGHSPQVNLPALLRTIMRNARTHIAETAVHVRPLTRLADWSCMSVMTRGPNFQLEAGLIRKARV